MKKEKKIKDSFYSGRKQKSIHQRWTFFHPIEGVKHPGNTGLQRCKRHNTSINPALFWELVGYRCFSLRPVDIIGTVRWAKCRDRQTAGIRLKVRSRLQRMPDWFHSRFRKRRKLGTHWALVRVCVCLRTWYRKPYMLQKVKKTSQSSLQTLTYTTNPSYIKDGFLLNSHMVQGHKPGTFLCIWGMQLIQ